MRNKLLAAIAGVCTVATGCFTLDVPAVQPDDGTAYTREEVLKDPALIELVVGGVFINFWGGLIQDEPWIPFSAYGEEFSSSVNTFSGQFWSVVQEPRVEFNNSLSGNSNFARDGWSNFYEANAAATEMPRLIMANNIRIIDGATGQDNTTRLLTFAKWIQGMSHVQLGLIFDSAAIINTQVDLSDVPILPLRPYTEVLDSGIKWLKEVVELATNNTFLLPLNDDLWVYNTAFTNEEMARVAHSFIARAYAYGARTPEERAAANWDSVKFHASRGVTAPFGPMGQPNPLITHAYRQAATSAPDNSNAICNGFCTGAGAMRVDNRLVGPADTSGNYQAWLTVASGPDFQTAQPFDVLTPDARIQVPGSISPLLKPTFFKHTNVRPPATSMDTTLRGTYYISKYWNSSRALNNGQQFPRDGGGRNRRSNNVATSDLDDIKDAMIYPVEMDLLVAEAEFRLGNFGAAADKINISRVANGELPEVDAGGVTDENSCVPQRYDGSCGDLWDALVYEKRMETYASGIAFFDARGWGCLLEGTLLHLPPPGRQLDLQNKPIYTYGGVGRPGSAVKPTNCPLLHRPS